MAIVSDLKSRWENLDYPFLIKDEEEIFFSDLAKVSIANLGIIKKGDVVAIIGDFEPTSIITLLNLLDLKIIVAPFTLETRNDHEYFFDSCGVDVVIEGTTINRIRKKQYSHPLLSGLRQSDKSGLVLFSTGTTGRPKAILHDLDKFLVRFQTPRPTLKTLNFLLFDHIGGLNTLLHTLYNKGTIVATEKRTVENILQICKKNKIELLPTTPTFLRMIILSGLSKKQIPSNLRIITYGTERMDQVTLNELNKLLPEVDFRQTFGMSELGILRVKSESSDSLFMEIGGEGIETKILNNILYIKSENKMMGYLNADQPFDEEGWYNTKDVVETRGKYIKVTGRDNEVINVGGQKFMASEVERVALEHKYINFAQVSAKENPITGQHVEIIIQLDSKAHETKKSLNTFFNNKLPKHMCPQRIILQDINIGHRFKKI